jgi:hypothetical protein
MSFAKYESSFTEWLDEHMMKGGADVPARLLTLLCLLERLRDLPVFNIDQHKADSGMQLIEHNAFIDRALERFAVASPVQEKGRRSNNLHAWANPLFAWLTNAGFQEDAPNDDLLHGTQAVAAKRLALINDDKPLIARYSKGTAVAVIADILDQAQEKKRAKDVAEYLVGAKLESRFGNEVVKPKNVNTPSLGHLADFRIGNTAIEVTTVERADRSHLDQITRILQNTGLEVWLLTRMKDREKWQHAVDALFESQASRIVVADIETFVGQNVSEIGNFQSEEVTTALAALFDRYTTHWLPRVGAGGLRIVNMESGGADKHKK